MTTRRHFILSSAAVAAVPFARYPALAEDKPPFKLFDSHVHLFTDDLRDYPMVATDQVKPRLLKDPNTVDKILRDMDENGVERCAAVQYRTAYGTDNRYVLDSAKTHPRRIVPVVILDAVDPKSPAVLRDLVKGRGAAGLRITGVPDKDGGYAWLDSPAAQNTWAAADALGIAVVLMPVPPEAPTQPLDRIGALAAKFPNTHIVLDHIGWPAVEGPPDFGLTKVRAALGPHRNVAFKLSTINFTRLAGGKIPATDFVRHLIDVFGADRVMWGSDFGNSKGAYAELVALGLSATATLKPAERRHVLRETGKRLFVPGGRGKA